MLWKKTFNFYRMLTTLRVFEFHIFVNFKYSEMVLSRLISNSFQLLPDIIACMSIALLRSNSVSLFNFIFLLSIWKYIIMTFFSSVEDYKDRTISYRIYNILKISSGKLFAFWTSTWELLKMINIKLCLSLLRIINNVKRP